jgi:heme oxygenase
VLFVKPATAITEDDTLSPIVVPAPTLRDLLRSTTSEIHERLHGHRGLSAVQDGSIDRAAYTALLSRLYGFHRPFELAAKIDPQRTRWLESDLTVLGVDAERRSALPCCSLFPTSASPAYILGARYVVEGSALGGRGLARGLDGLLGSGASAGRCFFSGYGAETGAMWRNYLDLLSSAPNTKAVRTAAINGATATFAIFEQWLAGWDKQHD